MLLHCFRASLPRCSHALLLQTSPGYAKGATGLSEDSSADLRRPGLKDVQAPGPPECRREPRGGLSRAAAATLNLRVGQHLEPPADELVGNFRAPAGAPVSEQLPQLGEAAALRDAPGPGLHADPDPGRDAPPGRRPLRPQGALQPRPRSP